jgi:hypothetical protein
MNPMMFPTGSATISGNVVAVTGGRTGILILCDKIRGTPRESYGIASFARSPVYLDTWGREVRPSWKYHFSPELYVPGS